MNQIEFASSPPTKTLRHGIVLPWSMLTAVITIASCWMFHSLREADHEKQMVTRCHMLAQSIVIAADAIQDPVEFQRFVMSSATEPGVDLLMVVDRSSLAVIGSSRIDFLNRSLDKIAADSHARDLLQKAIAQGEPCHRRVFSPTPSFTMAFPIASRADTIVAQHNHPGVVFVRLGDGPELARFRSSTTKQTAALLAAVAALALLGYAVLNNQIFHPLQLISQAMSRQASGDRLAYAPMVADNELGTLARTINGLIDSLGEREENEKRLRQDLEKTLRVAESTRREMEFRQYAINQAAIVAETDGRGVITYANDNFCNISGYSRDELLGENHRIIASGRHNKQFFRAMYQTLLSGNVWRGELLNRAKDGTLYWVDTTIVPTLDEKGKPTRYTAIRFDITQQKNAQDRFQLMVEAARAGLWDWCIPKGTFFTNEQFQYLLGYEPECKTYPIDWFFDKLHPDDVDRTRLAVAKAFSSHDFRYDIEFRLKNANGDYRWMRSSGKVVDRDPDGIPTRMIGQHIDVHRTKTVEAELMQARKISESANQAKSEFLANMSHEIRTPLTAILGYADLLLEDGVGDPSATARHEMVRTVQRNGEHLLAIINDILDLSKIEAGKMTIELLDASLQQTVQEVIELMEVRAIAKNLRLVTEFSGPLPATFRTDPVRIRQILVNLVGNAIKFTETGEVRLRVRLATSPPAAPLLEFSVIDSGIGMSDTQMDRIFQAFGQADTSTTRRFGGTGLGLLISKRLAEMLGGTIQVTSELGRGSQFTVTVSPGELQSDQLTILGGEQRQSAQVSMPQPATPATDQPLAGIRILFAEDGPDNQRLISFVLRRAGAEVTIVNNGLEAVRALTVDKSAEGPLLAPCPFEILLLDMQMPLMDGYTAARELVARGITIPILALTAHAMDGEQEKCIAAGCSAYATKPIQRQQLIAQVAALGRPQPAGINLPRLDVAAQLATLTT